MEFVTEATVTSLSVIKRVANPATVWTSNRRGEPRRDIARFPFSKVTLVVNVKETVRSDDFRFVPISVLSTKRFSRNRYNEWCPMLCGESHLFENLSCPFNDTQTRMSLSIPDSVFLRKRESMPETPVKVRSGSSHPHRAWMVLVSTLVRNSFGDVCEDPNVRTKHLRDFDEHLHHMLVAVEGS